MDAHKSRMIWQQVRAIVRLPQRCLISVGAAGAGLPEPPGDADRAVCRRRHDGYRASRAGGRDRKASRPAHPDREPHRGRRRDRPAADGDQRRAGRLHHLADPDHGVPLSVHHQDHVQSAQRSELHHQPVGLHLRHRGEARRALENLSGPSRRRQGQSRQDQLRHARRRHDAAPDDGADRQAAGHQMDPRAVPRHVRTPPMRCSAATSASSPTRAAGRRWSTTASCACW